MGEKDRRDGGKRKRIQGGGGVKVEQMEGGKGGKGKVRGRE